MQVGKGKGFHTWTEGLEQFEFSLRDIEDVIKVVKNGVILVFI